MNRLENKTYTASDRLFHPKDSIVALIILAFCAWLYYLTTHFESVSDMFAQDITPAFFPRLLLFTIIPLALLLPFEHRLFGNGEQLDKGRSDSVGFMTYLTILLQISCLLALPWLGVYLVLVCVCFSLPLLWGERNIVRVLLFSAIFPLVVTLVFTQILKVYFEPGVFNLGFR